MNETARLKLLLSNCAYWAMNALALNSGRALGHMDMIRETCLENILNVSKEFIIHEPDTDSTVHYDGLSATLVPEEGWPAPEIEWMDAKG